LRRRGGEFSRSFFATMMFGILRNSRRWQALTNKTFENK
jgi:hypothetical protein